MRKALRRAAIAADRNHARAPHRDDVEPTLTLAALAAGRWVLVDCFGTDGRAYVVARRCESGTRAPTNLTTRQRQVLALLIEGRADKYIASELAITASSVASHRATALRKLGLHSRVELIRLCALFGGVATPVNGGAR